ncbi:MAG TPA: histidine phosphatase family protein [Dermatophilaceae bacterium]|nr:histidine phosphatase family protein [Dermatophilaceae bacterium]
MTATTATTRTLFVWRHGQTEHNAGNIWQGHLDTHLSEVGRAQATAAAAALSVQAPTVIWSSDLARAADTAAALARLVRLPVRYDDRLREIHVGQWQGLSAGDVAERYPQVQAALAAGEDVRRGVDGETLAEVASRVRDCTEQLLAELPDRGCAVVVTHGVSGRALVASLVGLPQSTAWNVLAGLANCGWARLVEDPDSSTWRITHWNAGAPAQAPGRVAPGTVAPGTVAPG